MKLLKRLQIRASRLRRAARLRTTAVAPQWDLDLPRTAGSWLSQLLSPPVNSTGTRRARVGAATEISLSSRLIRIISCQFAVRLLTVRLLILGTIRGGFRV